MSSSRKDKSTVMLGSGLAGAIEVSIFQPIDTVTKRLMNNPNPIYNRNLSFNANYSAAVKLALTNPKLEKSRFSFLNIGEKPIKLYKGVGWGMGYKILQRMYKFGGQPILEDYLKDNYFSHDDKVKTKVVSGAIMGAGEVVFLPLDIYKIKQQTGAPEPFSKFIFNKNIYRGAFITSTRNTFGSAALFGIPELVETKFYENKKLSESEKMVTRAAGSVASLVVSSPFDVIKVRKQAEDLTESSFKIGYNILKNNPFQFFKGITPKIATQGVKLTGFLTIKDWVVDKLQEERNKLGI